MFATGYGLHLALPLLRKHSEEEARKLLEKYMKVLFYRNCRTLNSFQIGTITKNGVNITKPFSIEKYNPLAPTRISFSTVFPSFFLLLNFYKKKKEK